MDSTLDWLRSCAFEPDAPNWVDCLWPGFCGEPPRWIFFAINSFSTCTERVYTFSNVDKKIRTLTKIPTQARLLIHCYKYSAT